MTLESLNTRYLKLIRNMAIIGVSLLLASGSLTQRSAEATGFFVNEQKLTASDGAPSVFFGNSVAVSGSTIVVGVPFDTRGSAYVFNQQRGSWIETQKLTVGDGAAGDQFGFSIAVSGSTIVVGRTIR